MPKDQFAKAVKPLTQYTRAEDILSSSFHGIGITLSIAGTAILVTFAALYADAWAIVSSAIFGASMIFLYSASTIYHAVRSDSLKKRLKKLDHIAIYYLIAGTYTPFMLVNLRGALGWSVFGVIWALAILGTILKLCKPVNGAKKWSVGLYLGMGWLIIIALKPLIEAMPTVGLFYLVLGGIFYSLGVIFYVWKSKKYTHAIWHLFVLAGTVTQFFAVLYSCIIPTS